MKHIKIAFIGGDLRQISAARYFAGKGAEVNVWGFDGCRLPEKVQGKDTLQSACEGARAIILPLPYGKEGELNCPLTEQQPNLAELLPAVSPETIIMGGKLDLEAYKLAEAHNNKITDYYGREELSVLNAVPTAEGAVETAMRELPVTLFGSKMAIIGFGRIGKVLARALCALGADVTVFARKPEAKAWARIYGCKTETTDNMEEKLSEFVCIFNTVPAPVLGARELCAVRDGAIIIDLASAPGGVDKGAAEKAEVRVITALSLPGRVAPDSAGEIIAETIENILLQEDMI